MDQRWIEMDGMIGIDWIWIGDGLVKDVRWILFGWIEARLKTSPIFELEMDKRWIVFGMKINWS